MVRQRRSASNWLSLVLLCWGALAAFAGACQAGTRSVPKSSADPYMTVRVRAADLVFVGRVRLLERSECLASGLVLSRQGIVFNVEKVLKGQVTVGTDFTVYHTLTGSGPLEVLVDECIQLSPELISIGRNFIVSCKLDKSPTSRGGCGINGGPWIADNESERSITMAIALGSISDMEQVWLLHEVAVERFIENQEPIPKGIPQSIKFFEDVTGIKSSERDKDTESISRAALRDNLESWKKWYECHGDSLVWDDKTFKVVADKEKLRKDEPCNTP